jgi:anti-anti-sigma factor
MRYRFANCVLDTDHRELYVDETPAPLEPKAYQILVYLVQNCERLVTRDELLEHVWPDVYVHDSAVARRIQALRQAVGDSSNAQQIIQTRRGHGYRFVASIVEEGNTPEALPAKAEATLFLQAMRRFFQDYLMVLNARGSFGKLVQQAMQDMTLRQRLLETPQQALSEADIALPASLKVEFLDNTDKVFHLVLPFLLETRAVEKKHATSHNPVKRAIARAGRDAAYRARLLADPRRALAEEGMEAPPDIDIQIHENTEDQLRFVLPNLQALDLQTHQPQLPSGSVADVPEGLELEWRGTSLIAVGRIDSLTAPALRRELERVVSDVDLVVSAVTFLSSAGLSALLSGQKHLMTHASHLRLIDAPEVIRNVLEIVGFLDFFELVDRDAESQTYMAW